MFDSSVLAKVKSAVIKKLFFGTERTTEGDILAKSKNSEHKMEIVFLNISEIRPYPNNNKIHDDDQIDQLAGLLDEFGADQPIVLDANKVIIKGEGRWLAAKRLNWETYPCTFSTHLTEHQVIANRIADNKGASLKYDKEKIRFDVGTLDRAGYDLSKTALGFDSLKDLMRSKEDGIDTGLELSRAMSKGYEEVKKQQADSMPVTSLPAWMPQSPPEVYDRHTNVLSAPEVGTKGTHVFTHVCPHCGGDLNADSESNQGQDKRSHSQASKEKPTLANDPKPDGRLARFLGRRSESSPLRNRSQTKVCTAKKRKPK